MKTQGKEIEKMKVNIFVKSATQLLVGLLLSLLLPETKGYALDFGAKSETFEICTENKRYISNDLKDKKTVEKLSVLPAPNTIDAASDEDVIYAEMLLNRPGVVRPDYSHVMPKLRPCSEPEAVKTYAAIETKIALLEKKTAHLNLWLIQPPGRQTIIEGRPIYGVDLIWDPANARSIYIKTREKLKNLYPNEENACVKLLNDYKSNFAGDQSYRIAYAIGSALQTGVDIDKIAENAVGALIAAGTMVAVYSAELASNSSAQTGELTSIPIRGSVPFANICKTKTKSKFKTTSKTHSEIENLEQVVKNECGSNYRIADWTDIFAFRGRAEAFIKQVDMKVGEGEGKSFIITNNGQHFWNSQRHYFISRFDHNKPGHYLAHDNIDNHYISLGSWYGLKMQVLCIEN